MKKENYLALIKKYCDSNLVRHGIAFSIFMVLSIITLRSILFSDSLFTYRDVVWSYDPASLMEVFFTLDLDSARRVIFLGPYFFVIKSLGFSTVVHSTHFFC